MDTKIVTIDLDTRSYDIYIGKSLLFSMKDYMPQDVEGASIFIVTDKNVEQYAKTVRDQLNAAGARICEIKVLPPGEKTKSFAHTEAVCSWMLDNGINRDSLVIAVGGGVIGDLTGFCASIVMRGVSYIQVPTTLLSQVDSSVGGKTGISTPQGKNLVGSFCQPDAVIIDIETLQTLPKRELLAGYAEVVKYGLIQDLSFFEWLEKNGARVCNLDEDAVVHAIEKSVKAKAIMVESDEKEEGRRALLNLGHTFGHALELAAGYGNTLLHGEAVSIGMVMAFDLSRRMGLCSEADVERVEQHLSEIGLWTYASYVDALSASVDGMMKSMQKDKKVTQGQMVFIIANAIGEAFVSKDVPEDLVRDTIRASLGGDTKGAKGRWASAFSSLS